jgi:hypothetical protein
MVREFYDENELENNENESYENFDESVDGINLNSFDDVSSFNSIRNKSNRRFKKNDVNNNDAKSGEHTIRRRGFVVQVFTTKMIPGARIRNAITGAYEEDSYVGRIDEYSFFKVKLSTGELGKMAPSTSLFYDSPEQYERHMGVTVALEIKSKWKSNKDIDLYGAYKEKPQMEITDNPLKKNDKQNKKNKDEQEVFSMDNPFYTSLLANT